KLERCESTICWAEDDRGTPLGGVVLAQDGGSVVVRAMIIHGKATEAAPGAAHPVAAAGSTAATERALAELRVDPPRRVLGEASLGQEGTIGVAESADDDRHLIVAVTTGGYARAFDDTSMIRGGITVRDVRFADIDGDGRTDAIVRSQGRWKDATTVVYTRVLIAPHSVQDAEIAADVASDLAVSVAPSLDDAVQAAAAVPTRGTTTNAACGVVRGAHTLAGFRRAAVPNARVLTFDETAAPTLHGTNKPLASLRPDDVRPVGRQCRALVCANSRPLCSYDDGLYSEYYWFTWDAGKMRLAGAAFYNGQ
ncbi:MAG TPA: hypothetical protein VFF43_06100, partial [Caldimonas sp.]|nr:hypothetical protein [Caldimonas sp.]